jgi:hypothetical protein
MDRTSDHAQHLPPDLPTLMTMLELALDHVLPAQRVAEHRAAVLLLQRTLTALAGELVIVQLLTALPAAPRD